MKLIQSYLQERYFVSTAYRKASTIPVVYYYETIVWDWDVITKQTGKIIRHEDSGISEKQALDNHCKICQELISD